MTVGIGNRSDRETGQRFPVPDPILGPRLSGSPRVGTGESRRLGGTGVTGRERFGEHDRLAGWRRTGLVARSATARSIRSPWQTRPGEPSHLVTREDRNGLDADPDDHAR